MNIAKNAKDPEFEVKEELEKKREEISSCADWASGSRDGKLPCGSIWNYGLSSKLYNVGVHQCVVRYGKPYCRVDDLEAFLCRYITKAFEFKEQPAKANMDV